MVAHNVLKRILPHILIVFLVLWTHACASDQQQGEVTEEVEGGEGEGGNEEEAAAAPEGETLEAGDGLEGGAAAQGGDLGAEEVSNFNNLSNINDLANGAADAAAENPAAAAAPSDAQAFQDPVTGGIGAAAGVAQGGETGGRVVRFVMSDSPVYGAPQAGGAPVATMVQGDPVVVVIQGEWAQITDKHFIMTSALSEAIIPRVKTPMGWSGDQPSP